MDGALDPGARGARSSSTRSDSGKPNKKDASIETLRGVAIVLLVFLHSEEPTAPDFITHDGLRSVYHHINFTFGYLRLPLFTVISGYVYALRPLPPRGDILTFFQGKARRILLPLVTATTLSLLFVAALDGNPIYDGEIWKSYFFGYRHYWFLQALIQVIVVVAVVEWLGGMNTLGRWALCEAVAVLLALTPNPTRFFSFDGFLFLLPFFVFGVGLYRYDRIRSQRGLFAVAVTIVIAGLTLQQLGRFGVVDIPIQRAGLLGIVVGLAANYVLFMVRRPIPFLAWIGAYSYAIYLFHHFGISLGKRVFIASELGSNDVYFLVKLTLGLCVPIVIEVVSRRYMVSRRLLLGLR